MRPCLALCLVWVAASIACSRSEPKASRASVVVITLDTTRADHLPVYGYDKPTAPNLERLARDGMVFDRFVTMSSWTLPSHASLFTGLSAATHTAHYNAEGDVTLSDALGESEVFSTFRANRLPEEAVTLAEVLRDAGYRTIGVGAGPWLKPVFGLGQGFDFFDTDFESKNGRKAEEVNHIALTELARVEDEPFLLFLNYFDPHDPYDSSSDGWERFLDAGAPSKRAETLAQYDSEIFYTDRHIGELLDALDGRGLYDESWIVVTSDHGELFGEHGLEYHGFSLYEEVVRGVLIVKPPAGVELDLDPSERSQSADVMPTLLARLGIEAPAMEGQPLGSITRPVVAELYRNPGTIAWRGKGFDRDLRAVYQGRYKLVVSTRAKDRHSGLFDLEQDPEEKQDLRATRPRVADALRAALRTWEAGLLPRLTPSAVDRIDDATKDQLEALGYLPGDGPSDAAPSSPSPRSPEE